MHNWHPVNFIAMNGIHGILQIMHYLVRTVRTFHMLLLAHFTEFYYYFHFIGKC